MAVKVTFAILSLLPRLGGTEAIKPTGECYGESIASCTSDTNLLLQAKVEKVIDVSSFDGRPKYVASAQEELAKRSYTANHAMSQATSLLAKARKAYHELEDLRKKNGGALELGKGWWTRTVYGTVVDPQDPSKPGKAPADCWKSPVFGQCMNADYEQIGGCCWQKDLPCDDNGCNPDSMSSALADAFGFNMNKYAPFTIQQDCDRTPGCNFYTCWIVGGSTMQCRVYSEGLLVLGVDGREMDHQVQQKYQLSSCKGCMPESIEAHKKRCGAKTHSVCTSLSQLEHMCAKVDMRVHTDITIKPNSPYHQFFQMVYLSPEQLQCHGASGWPEPRGIALVNIPSKSLQLKIIPAGTTKTYGSLTQSRALSQLTDDNIGKMQEKIYKLTNLADTKKRNALAEIGYAVGAYQDLVKFAQNSLVKGKGWWTHSLLASVVDPDDPSKPGKAPSNCWNSKHFGRCRTANREPLDGCCYRADLACNDGGCAPRAFYQGITLAGGALLMTVEKACEETPGCAFYTCWQVEHELQCRVYSEGLLVLGTDGRETSGKVAQTNQVSSCKGCTGEAEEDRQTRCGAKSDGVCTSLDKMAEQCSKVDMRIHYNLEDVPESKYGQVLYAIYYAPDQLQCLGLKEYPELVGSGTLGFPVNFINVTVKYGDQ